MQIFPVRGGLGKYLFVGIEDLVVDVISSGSERVSATNSCEHGNKLPYYVRSQEYID
jgi:hypothetical protein